MSDGMMNDDSAINNYLSDMMQGRDVETASGLLDDASQGLRQALALAEASGLKPEALSAGGTWFRASVTPFSLGVEPSTGRDVRIMFYNGADAEHETAAAIRACVASYVVFGR